MSREADARAVGMKSSPVESQRRHYCFPATAYRPEQGRLIGTHPWIIWYAVLLHTLWAFLLLASERPYGATALHVYRPVPRLLRAGALVAASALAAWAITRRQPSCPPDHGRDLAGHPDRDGHVQRQGFDLLYTRAVFGQAALSPLARRNPWLVTIPGPDRCLGLVLKPGSIVLVADCVRLGEAIEF
jgi:hypothetical protein